MGRGRTCGTYGRSWQSEVVRGTYSFTAFRIVVDLPEGEGGGKRGHVNVTCCLFTEGCLLAVTTQVELMVEAKGLMAGNCLLYHVVFSDSRASFTGKGKVNGTVTAKA